MLLSIILINLIRDITIPAHSLKIQDWHTIGAQFAEKIYKFP